VILKISCSVETVGLYVCICVFVFTSTCQHVNADSFSHSFILSIYKTKTLPAFKNSLNCTWWVIPSIRYCDDSDHSCEAP